MSRSSARIGDPRSVSTLLDGELSGGKDVEATLGGADPTRAGRYAILGRLGRGAMAVVYIGYDDDLDRQVAIKFIEERRAQSTRARARMRREAQAMARLSHANVAHVYEVGEQDERIFIAMEYLGGGTLRGWLDASDAPRPWRDVLRRYIAAGRGLAAAHEAGIVHRDFKPENVLLTREGEPRVADFGLAGLGELEPTDDVDRSHPGASDTSLTAAGALVGTPRYMSPEQHRGEPADVRSDQFSYCVALFEGLHGDRPFAGGSVSELAEAVTAGKRRDPPASGRRVPAWLDAVCNRGLCVRPEDRFPSMNALLDALERGQERARWRAGAFGLAGVAVVASALAGVVAWGEAERVAACEGRGADIVGAWNDDARERVKSGMLASGAPYARTSIDAVLPGLDAQASDLQHVATRACLDAQVRGTLAPDQHARAAWCLEERRDELFAVIHQLEGANARAVRLSVGAVADLGRPASCVDPMTLASLPIPAEGSSTQALAEVRRVLARAAALRGAGAIDAAVEVAEAAHSEASAIGWPPLLAAVKLEEGRALDDAGRYADAEAPLVDAYLIASEADAWGIASDAASKLVHLVGYRLARYDEGRLWRRLAGVAGGRTGDPLRLRAAQLLSNATSLESEAGNYADAIAMQEEALEIWKAAYGPDHLFVARGLTNLGGIHYETGDYARAGPLLEEALAIRERTVGADHPSLAHAQNNLGVLYWVTDDFARAKSLLGRALAIREVALGPDHPDVALTLSNLALVHQGAQDYDEAKALYGRALAILEGALGPEHPKVAKVLSNLALVLRKTEQHGRALPLYERALVILEGTQGRGHIDVAECLHDLGVVHTALGAPDRALPLLERSIEIFDGEEGVQRNELPARFDLARALVLTGGDRARAVAQAETAAAGIPAGTPRGDEIAAFLAEHRG